MNAIRKIVRVAFGQLGIYPCQPDVFAVTARTLAADSIERRARRSDAPGLLNRSPLGGVGRGYEAIGTPIEVVATHGVPTHESLDLLAAPIKATARPLYGNVPPVTHARLRNNYEVGP